METNISHTAQTSLLPIEQNGDIHIWFAMRELLFATQAPEGYYVVEPTSLGDISRAKIITFIENYNKVVVLWPEPYQAFEAFAAQMEWVEAAGGVVESESGEVVMIRRNERWDLPKGHREEGESFAECAAREAGEETGVEVAQVGKLLTTTLHAYNLYGRWELKLTVWYAMRAEAVALTPQREEGIICAEWITRERIGECVKNSFPTIKKVFSAFLR